MSQKLKPSWDYAKDEAPPQASAEFVYAYSAIADAITATSLNAQAGLNWLNVQPPDLKEVRRVLDGIANDGKRAADMVVQLRTLLEPSSPR
jgi:hypothetical protein